MSLLLATWPLLRQNSATSPQLEDLPEIAATAGFGGLEIMDRQLPALDSSTVAKLCARIQEQKSRTILDLSTDTTLEGSARQEQLRYVRTMIATAPRFGAGKIRLLLGGQGLSIQKIFRWVAARDSSQVTELSRPSPSGSATFLLHHPLVGRVTHWVRKQIKPDMKKLSAKRDRAVDFLKEVTPEAHDSGIQLVIENHWGISTYPETMIEIVEEVDSPALAVCLDFTNFPRHIDHFEAFRILLPHARHIHAKSRSFDADGEETQLDYQRYFQAIREQGYAGTIAVEFEGSGDPLTGAIRTRDLIRRYRDN